MATQDGKDGNQEGQPPPAGKGGTQLPENSTGCMSPVSPPTPWSSISDTEPENIETQPTKDTRKKGTARKRRERLKRSEARAKDELGKRQQRNQQRKRRKLNAEKREQADLSGLPVAAEHRLLPSLPCHLAPVKDDQAGGGENDKTRLWSVPARA